jgi:hypothetical protein
VCSYLLHRRPRRGRAASACPGKMGTGFPKKDMRKSKNLERIAIQTNWDARSSASRRKAIPARPATAASPLAAARPAFPPAIRRNISESVPSQTRCRTDPSRSAIFRSGAAHRHAADGAVSLVDVTPMHAVRQLHARELGANLPAVELLQFLFCLGISGECNGAEDRARGHAPLHRVLHWKKSVCRSENISATPDASSKASTILRNPASSTRP